MRQVIFVAVVGIVLARSASPAPRTAAPAFSQSPIVGQLGGTMRAVATDGRWAYVGEGNRVRVFEFAGAMDLRPVSTTPLLPGAVNDLALAGSRLVVGHSNGVVVVDVSDPRAPDLRGSHTILGGAQRVVLVNRYIYVMARGLIDLVETVNAATDRVIDFSDPDALKDVGRLDSSMARDFATRELRGFSIGDQLRMSIHGLDDPAHPQVLATVQLHAYGRALAMVEDRLLVAGGDKVAGGDLRIFRVTDPLRPVLMKQLSVPKPANSVAVAGQWAFVGTELGVQVVDLTMVDSPRLDAALAGPPVSRVVRVDAERVLVTDALGLQLLRRGTASLESIRVWRSLGAVNDVAVGGGHTILATSSGGLAVADTTEADSPRIIGRVDVASPVWQVAVDGQVALGLSGTSSDAINQLVTVDVSDPAAPQLRGELNLALADTLALGDGMAVVAGRQRSGLAIATIDLRNPSQPVVMGSLAGNWQVKDLLYQRPILYVTDRSVGLRIVDLGDPRDPQVVSSLPFLTQLRTRGMALAGGQLYTVGWPAPALPNGSEYPEDVLVTNVTDPSQPRHQGWLPIGAWPRGIAVGNGRVYVASGSATGTDPDSDKLVVREVAPNGRRGEWPLPTVSRGIALNGGQALIAGDNAGLIVIAAEADPFAATPTVSAPPTQSSPSPTVPLATPVLPATVTPVPFPTRTPVPTEWPQAPVTWLWLPHVQR